jgi:hypothetical protein
VAFAVVTVKVDELPETIEVGLAAIVTVGSGFGVIVRITGVEVAVPPGPVAVAV